MIIQVNMELGWLSWCCLRFKMQLHMAWNLVLMYRYATDRANASPKPCWEANMVHCPPGVGNKYFFFGSLLAKRWLWYLCSVKNSSSHGVSYRFILSFNKFKWCFANVSFECATESGASMKHKSMKYPQLHALVTRHFWIWLWVLSGTNAHVHTESIVPIDQS